MPINLGGMNPEQMLQSGQLATQLMGQQTARQRLQHDVESERIGQKMELLNSAIAQKFNEKKLQLEQRRAAAYEQNMKAQATQQGAATDKLRKEMEQMDKQAAFLNSAKDTLVKTTLGDMPLATAMAISEAGAPEGFALTDQEWKHVGSFTNNAGKQVDLLMQPATGQMQERESTFATEAPSSGEGVSKWEAPAGKLDEAQQSIYKNMGVSDLTGLRPESQPIASDAEKLSEILLIADPAREGGPTGVDALSMAKKYHTSLRNLPEGKGVPQAKKFVKQAIKVLMDVGQRAQESGVPLRNFEYSSMNESYIRQMLLEKGYSEKEANTVIGQSLQELRNANAR